jgi:LmbE family N-acetylglucosaminyl deacetylase
MRSLTLGGPGRGPLRVLCLGAHSDDIEIGCGGTLLSLRAGSRRLECHWVVFSGTPARQAEARRGFGLFVSGVTKRTLTLHGYRDGFFPDQFGAIKESFEALKQAVRPDVIFTHYRADRHQDHRVISDLTWNTFRDHCILEYEVPKFDGDLGIPNVFQPLTLQICQRKVRYLNRAFASQRDKRWFTDSTFLGLMRLRGIECVAPEGYAEAFHGRKVVLGG